MPSFLQMASGSQMAAGEAEQVLRELLGGPRPQMCQSDTLH